MPPGHRAANGFFGSPTSSFRESEEIEMRLSAVVAAVTVLGAAPALAQDSVAAQLCRYTPCNIVIEWGSSGANQPDVDQRYGAPSELEASFRNRLRDGGFTLGAGEGATIMTVRVTMNNAALCDALPGTGSSYKCKTASRAAVVFSGGSMAKPVPPIDVIPRCGDPK